MSLKKRKIVSISSKYEKSLERKTKPDLHKFTSNWRNNRLSSVLARGKYRIGSNYSIRSLFPHTLAYFDRRMAIPCSPASWDRVACPVLCPRIVSDLDSAICWANRLVCSRSYHCNRRGIVLSPRRLPPKVLLIPVLDLDRPFWSSKSVLRGWCAFLDSLIRSLICRAILSGSRISACYLKREKQAV